MSSHYAPAEQVTEVGPNRFQALGPRHLDTLMRRFGISSELGATMRVLALVLPFRVNEYVLTELIDWDRIPEDALFQMVFPQPGMLPADVEAELSMLAAAGHTAKMQAAVRAVRQRLNPHPSNQLQLNVPRQDGVDLPGMQHKYRETVLYFPRQGQSCHAFCTYCFRWAQFVGDPDLRFAASAPHHLTAYLREHPEVTDVLITGGDPLIMSTERLRSHLEPLLTIPTVRTIRIGTKAPAYWPYRFLGDPDADDLLRLFEEVVASGRSLAVMTHFSHPRELAPDPARRALGRIRGTGALIFGQAPLLARVNDSALLWNELWRLEIALGVLPYYMFVERDTGPQEYFRVPLTRAVRIFQDAYRQLPGLARTVRGPVMSTTPGKVVVDGADGTEFHLRFLQARDPALVGRPFRAAQTETAAWLHDLRPSPGTAADIMAAVTVAPRPHDQA